MKKYSSKIKLKVLKYSLRLEKVASLSLAFILDIDDPDKTKTLGNKSSSISFNQKLNLLFDSQSIEKLEKEKMEIFMEVRNQFMHNLDVDSFEDVFNHLNGKENRLRKIYPDLFNEETSLEISLDKATEMLYLEGMLILRSYKGARDNKMQRIEEANIYKSLYKSTPQAIDKALTMLIEDINDETFNFRDKDELVENIKLLKKQIILYQLTENEE